MLVSLDQGEQLVDSGKLSEGLTVFRDVYRAVESGPRYGTPLSTTPI